jgi:hypothetical protein
VDSRTTKKLRATRTVAVNNTTPAGVPAKTDMRSGMSVDAMLQTFAFSPTSMVHVSCVSGACLDGAVATVEAVAIVQ